MSRREKEMWNKVFEDFKDLSKNNHLVGKDKDGTEYWAPKKIDLELWGVMEERMATHRKYSVIRHWVNLKVELNELIKAIRLYLLKRNI
jgi:hypothetical protein